jgi:acyl-CoA synthetase (AMP-forming)/AMP-acid ligase II
MDPVNDTLWSRWEAHARARPGAVAVVTWQADAEPVRWTWEKLIAAARGAAASLASAGVGKGDVCGVMLRHTPQFHPIYMGLCALGAIPSVLAYPNARLHKDKFAHGLAGMARRSGLRWLLTERSLASTVEPLVSGESSSIEGLLFPLEMDMTQGRVALADVASEDTCLLQHSSGTTGLQKAVALSHRAVLEHVARYGAAVGLTADDKVASWLPLYHDMGLIAALHLPLAAGIPVIQLDPFEWVSDPGMLLEAISRERATLCWLPNFAYNLMATRIRESELSGIDLGSMRMFVNCSEPVRSDSHEKFLARFSASGLEESALAACYAMAEATFAVTQTPPGRRAAVLQADRRALSEGRYVPATDPGSARACVSSGRVVEGCDVRIVDSRGGLLPDHVVGDVELRSVSLFDGYRNDEERTRAVLKDGWYSTGDYGFRDGDDHYIIGRSKDLIIVAGKNLYPEDVEDAVSEVAGVVPGRVVAFGEEDEALGTEVIAVIAETAVEDDRGRKALRLDILKAGMGIDVTIARVYLAPPRWLIKSSSGKPGRSANRERVHELPGENGGGR